MWAIDSRSKHLERHLGRRCRRIPSGTMAQPSEGLSSNFFNALIHRRPTWMHWKDDGDYRDEDSPSVSDDFLILLGASY